VYHGKRAGSMGKFGAFSFHGTKTVTTGEGGMFVTNDPTLYELILTFSNHGRVRGQIKQFWPDVVGFKYKMSNIQASIGCAQIERINELIGRKRDIFLYYRDHFASFPSLSMNPESADTVNGVWMPTVVFDRDSGITRERLLEVLQADNIDGRVFFHPLTSLPMFQAKPSNENSYDLPLRAINLPSYHDLSNTDQDRVIAVVKSLIAN
jgi:perosamine synthetase